MAQTGFTEEHCVGTVTGYGSFETPLEGRDPIRKFGINFQLSPGDRPVDGSENYGKVLLFETVIGSKESRAPTEGQKKRIMDAFAVLKYDPNQGLMTETQKKRVIGAQARVKVQKNNRGHWEIGFVDSLDAPARTGNYDPFERKLNAQDEEDFCTALEAFGREKLGVTETTRAPAGRTAAAGPTRPAATAGRAPATAAPAGRAAAAPASRAPAQRPQRQPNPDVGGDEQDSDQDIPF